MTTGSDHARIRELETIAAGIKTTFDVLDTALAAERTRREQAEAERDGADSRLEELEGHRYEVAEPSPSGKMGWRCEACGHYTNGPVKARFDQCPRSPYAQLQDSRDKAEHERDQAQADAAKYREALAIAVVRPTSDFIYGPGSSSTGWGCDICQQLGSSRDSINHRVDCLLSTPHPGKALLKETEK
jgi:hypothetical protein